VVSEMAAASVPAPARAEAGEASEQAPASAPG